MKIEQCLPKLMIPLVSIVLLSSLLCGWGFRNHYWDDPFIISVYARNIADGKGFVFNQDEKVFGTTTPLYTLMVSLVGLFARDVPLASNVIGIVSTSLLCVVVVCGFAGEGRKVAGMVCAFLILTLKQSYLFTGIETYVYALLIFGSIALYCRARYWSASLCVGLACLARYDGILAAVVLLAHYCYEKKIFPWRYTLLFGAVTIPWIIFSLAYFGDFLPQTFYAKKALIPARQYFAEYIIGCLGTEIIQNSERLLRIPAALLPLLGIVTGLSRSRYFRLVFFYAILMVVGYTIISTEDPWHIFPVMVVALIALGYGIDQVGCGVGSLARSPRLTRVLHLIVAASLCVPVLLAQFKDLEEEREGYTRSCFGARHRAYQQAAEWLNQNIPAGSSVHTTEPGTIAYYSHCIFFDYWGLVTRRGWRVGWRDAETTGADVVIWNDWEREDKHPVPNGYELKRIIDEPPYPRIFISRRVKGEA